MRGMFWLCALAAFIFECIRLAPASLWFALPGFQAISVSYGSASGTVWNGALTDVMAGGAHLGDVAFALDPVSIMRLRPKVALRASGGAVVGSGSVSVAGSTVRIDAPAVSANIESLGRFALFGEPLRGPIEIRNAKLALKDGFCVEAAGAASVDALRPVFRRINVAPETVIADLRCDGNSVAAHFAGVAPEASYNVQASIARDRSYRLEAALVPTRPYLEVMLQAAGFSKQGEALVFAEIGLLRPDPRPTPAP